MNIGPRSELRLADLKGRSPKGGQAMNLMVPIHVADAIAEMARKLNVPKNAVVVALLNEGLSVAQMKVPK